MKSILFPFSKNYTQLKNYWWHRLLIVAFILAVSFSGIFVWVSSNEADSSVYVSCLTTEIYVYDNSKSPDADQKYEAGKKRCSESFDQYRHPLINLIFGLVTAAITFYVLQVIYYKLALYIVYGKKS